MSLIYLKTGRSRTLTWSKTISGSDFVGSEGQMGVDPAMNSVVGGSLTVFFDANSPTTFLKTTGLIGLHPTVGGTGVRITATVVTPAGTFENESIIDVKQPPNVWTGPALTADLSVTIPVEEWCLMYRFEDIYGASIAFPNPAVASYTRYLPYSVNDGRTFPDYSLLYPGRCGVGAADGLASGGICFFEKAVAGAAFTVTATFCGVTETQAWTVPSDTVIDYLVEDFTNGSANSDQGVISFSATSVCLTGSTLQFEGESTVSHTDSGGTTQASNIGGVSISGSGTAVSAQVNQAGTSPIRYDLTPKLYAFGQDWPGTPVFDVQQAANRGSSGQFEGFTMGTTSAPTSFSQRRGGGTIIVGVGTQQTITLPYRAEWCPVRCWLDAPFLASTGDDASDWRVQFRGKAYPGFTIRQAASTEVFAASPPQSGDVRSGIVPSISNWEGYRFLSFDADQSASLTVTSPQGVSKTYSWTVAAPGTAEAVTLDLSSPSEWTGGSQPGRLPDIDDRQSRFPLDASGNPDETSGASTVDANDEYTDANGTYWGVFKAASMTVEKAAGSGTLNLGAMSLFRSADSDLSLLGTFLPYLTEVTGQAAVVMPFLRLASDFRLCDFPALRHVPGGEWHDFSIADAASTIAAVPGWSATLASSFPDAVWHNASGPAMWLGGGGTTIDAASTATQWIHRPIGSSSLTVIAQALYDEVSTYPGAGDVWSGFEYDPDHPETPLRAAKHLRGLADGLVLQSSGVPSSGQTVRAAASGVDEGSAVSLGDGRYETSLPYGKGSAAATTTLAVPPTPLLVETAVWKNREFHRVSFRRSAQGGGGPRLEEGDDGAMIACRLVDGTLVVDRSPLAMPPITHTAEHPELGSLKSARICLDPRRRLWLTTVDTASQASLYFSDDFGQSFSASSSVTMSAQLSDVRCSPTGEMLLIWFVPDAGSSGPGTFQGRRRAAGDLDFGTAFALGDGSGQPLRSDGSGFGFDAAVESAGRWALTFVADGDTSPSFWWSADGGQSWTRAS